MRYFTVFIFISLFSLGCFRFEDKAAVDAQIEFYSRIYDDFNQNPAQAVFKYRLIWSESIASGEGPYSTESALLAIAGHLVVHDPDNYEEYYEYILNGVNGRIYENRNYAISLLANVQGTESLDLIFNLLADDRAGGTMLRNAIYAIERRTNLATRHDSDEYPYIVQKFSQICANPHSSTVEDLCLRRPLLGVM